MEHHIGINVSLELSSLCVLDVTGKVILEALVAFLRSLGVTIVHVGLEAGPLSQWLYDGLAGSGLRGGAAGDAPRQGGAVRHGDQNRSP